MNEFHSVELNFESGLITGCTAAWQILGSLTESNRENLNLLCPELRLEVREAMKALIEGRRSTSSIRPTQRQIELGKEWLEGHCEDSSADNE